MCYAMNDRNPGEWRAASEPEPVEPGTDVAGAFVAVVCVGMFLCFLGYVVMTAGKHMVDDRAASAVERSR